ncbi:hypothetical protein ACFX2C_032382 [Malus domestica]
MWVPKNGTSRNVFQRLGGDSEPKNLYEIFRNHETSEEVEDKEAKIPKWVEVRPPQPSFEGRDVRVKGRTKNIISPVTKKDSARLGRKWYVVGKDGRLVKEMGASMIMRVQRQHKAHMKSLKVPATSKAFENVKFEKMPHRGRNQLQWRVKRRSKKLIGRLKEREIMLPQNPHLGKYRILRRAQRIR